MLVVVLGLALSGCGGQQSLASPARDSPQAAPLSPALTAGTCWDDRQLGPAMGRQFTTWVARYARGDARLGRALADDAAFSRRLDCGEPHAIELYNVVEVPRAVLREVTSYADLLDHGTALYVRVRDAVNTACAEGSPYAAADRAVGMPLQLGPSLDEDSGLRLAWDPFPPDRWARGEHRFVCTLEQDPAGTVRYADLPTRRLAESARVCLDGPGEPVPCSGPHRAEEIGEMVLNTAVDAGLVDARKAVRNGADGRHVALTQAEYGRLDKACRALLRRVSSRPAVAHAFPGSVAQWPTPEGAYVASCFALGSAGEPPRRTTGTVFDRDR